MTTIYIFLQAFKFLELPMPSEESLVKMVAAGGKGTNQIKGRAMLPEAAKLVYDLYTPHNERLAQLLQDDYYRQWNKVS